MHDSVSFRNGIDGLAAIARQILEKEPMDGTIFVFRNKRRQMLRLFFYDGGGFWLCTRRLSKGTFSAWPEGDGTKPCSPLLARELQVPDLGWRSVDLLVSGALAEGRVGGTLGRAIAEPA
jgi:hypothetical protein